jgi:hypothetical protein
MFPIASGGRVLLGCAFSGFGVGAAKVFSLLSWKYIRIIVELSWGCEKSTRMFHIKIVLIRSLDLIEIDRSASLEGATGWLKHQSERCSSIRTTLYDKIIGWRRARFSFNLDSAWIKQQKLIVSNNVLK